MVLSSLSRCALFVVQMKLFARAQTKGGQVEVFPLSISVNFCLPALCENKEVPLNGC